MISMEESKLYEEIKSMREEMKEHNIDSVLLKDEENSLEGLDISNVEARGESEHSILNDPIINELSSRTVLPKILLENINIEEFYKSFEVE